MRKKSFLLGAAALALSMAFTFTSTDAHASSDVPINEQTFPDLMFRDYVSRQFDNNNDGKLSEVERNRAKTMYLYNENVASLKGIEHFPYLQTLQCYNNPLSELNVSSNTRLSRLECQNTNIEKLDLTSNTILRYLNANTCRLTEVKFGTNNNLEEVYLYNNYLKSLDVSGCRNMTHLDARTNQISTLRLCKNSALKELQIYENKLPYLDVSSQQYLKVVSARNNEITKVNFSGCIALEEVYLGANKLSYIDVNSYPTIQKLHVAENVLTELNVSKLTELRELDCYTNLLKTLNLSNNTKLTDAIFRDNMLAAVTLPANTKVDTGYSWDNDYFITAYGDSIDLKRYDPAFKPEYVTKLSNLTLNGSVMSRKNSGEAYYEYVSNNLNMTVYITFKEGIEFHDVPQDTNNWKHQAVKFVSEKGLMGGVGGSYEFQPDEPLTRSMFATVLYRMAGSPEVHTGYTNFSDVKTGTWYTNAVRWASANKIVSGYSDGSFGINDNVTRDQIAKMLYVYGELKGYDMSGRTTLDAFADKAKVSGWAVPYLEWAVSAKMVSGRTADGMTKIDPKGNATRAECAKMLKVFMETYVK